MFAEPISVFERPIVLETPPAAFETLAQKSWRGILVKPFTKLHSLIELYAGLETAMVQVCFGQPLSLSSTSQKRWVTDVLLQKDTNSLSYRWLVSFWRRSLRSGSWTRLQIAEKGLLRCALWIAKARGKISNMRLMVQILRIALKLLDSARSRIAKTGRSRAMAMFEAYARPGGVFSWAPQMREWLGDPRYILYLGVMEVNR